MVELLRMKADEDIFWGHSPRHFYAHSTGEVYGAPPQTSTPSALRRFALPSSRAVVPRPEVPPSSWRGRVLVCTFQAVPDDGKFWSPFACILL